MRRDCFCTLVILAALCATIEHSTACAEALDPRDNNIPWGIASGAEWSGDHRQFNPLLNQAGVNWLRYFAEWHTIQPKQGEWNWNKADELVASAKANNIHLSGLFCYFAKWASADGGTRRFPVKDMQFWRDYVRETSSRYKDDIKYWEVWNEFNGSFAVDGTPQIYAELVKETYQTAKKVDPSLRIGLSVANFDVGFLDRAIKAGAADHFDFIAVHPYENLGAVMDSGKGEIGFLAMAANLRKMLAANRQRTDMPLWITEIGYQTTVKPDSKPDTLQAEALVKAYVLSLAQGFQRVCWFEARGPAYGHGTDHGIIRQDWSTRPAYDALKVLTTRLGLGPHYLGWVNPKGAYGFVFAGKDGPQLCLWTKPQASFAFHFPTPRRVVDLTSKERVYGPGEELIVGPSPIFLLDLAPALVDLAKTNKEKPFPWGGDESDSELVFCHLGPTPLEEGVMLMNENSLAAENKLTEEGRLTKFDPARPDANRYINFRVHPSYASFGNTHLEITINARRADPSKLAGMTLNYESLKGFRQVGEWWTIPAGEEFSQHTFKVSDANFVGAWAYNFAINALGSGGDFIVQDVYVEKVGK